MAQIIHEVTYDAPISRVWDALTDSEQLAAWLMPNDFSPEVGHTFTFRTKPAPGFDGIVHCEVKEVIAPTRLVYSWAAGNLDTVVTWELEERPGGQTRLRLTHDGFRFFKDLFIRTMLTAGWTKKLLPESLRSVVERS